MPSEDAEPCFGSVYESYRTGVVFKIIARVSDKIVILIKFPPCIGRIRLDAELGAKPLIQS